MALVNIWSFEPARGTWEPRVVEAASLRPRSQQHYWMFRVMAAPPAPCLRPSWWQPPTTVAGALLDYISAATPEPPERPRTNYERLAREIPKRARMYDQDDRYHREWSIMRTKRLRDDLVSLAERISARLQAQRDFTLAHFAANTVSDHEFIEAMFSLYSQGRARLLL
jgi:hypothetical protein